MASGETYDRLENTTKEGDKELLVDDGDLKESIPKSESEGSNGLFGELTSLKKPQKVLEASKAVLQDQSKGLKIIIVGSFVFSMVITIALILSIYLGPPQVGANAAVATDVKQCSDIGLSMISKGGNAMDAAVAALLCVGVVNAESSGLGGGGFMLIHDHKNEKSEVIDFRETAPSDTTPDMYRGQLDRLKSGTLSIGVPGELKGMEAAHKKYGKLAWAYVVQPAADLARNGFKMTGHTDFVLHHPNFNMDKFMASRLKQYYTNDDGKMKREDDLIYRPDLAATLDKIAEHGAEPFYSGSIADDIVKEIVNADVPGVLKKEDLRSYEIVTRDVVRTAYHDYTIESVPAPGSGPVVLSIMNFLEGYQITPNNMTYHRLLEAFKFGYAQKEKLGDPKFNHQEILNATNIMISKQEANRLRNLTGNMTKAAQFYGHSISLPEDKGTSHISVIDSAELIVSVTSSVNSWFGSMVLTENGILLNNQLADFNEPGTGNNLNEIQAGKRPLSSMSPTIVYETGHLCGLRMVCGGANGSRIITGIVQTLLNNLSLDMTLERSIAASRIHSQLENPDAKVVEAEVGFPESILAGLRTMGHDIQMTDKEQSLVNAVLKVKDYIEAFSDHRKKGAGASIFT